MNAKEARALADSEAATQWQMNKIHTAIEDAANRGKRNVFSPIWISMAVETILEGEGYRVYPANDLIAW